MTSVTADELMYAKATIARLERENAELRAQIAAYEPVVKAMKLLAERQCGSHCTDKDEKGIERYPAMKNRCASCIAKAAIEHRDKAGEWQS